MLTSPGSLGTLSPREELAMNPAYQGQVDVFCAAYAVINAMRHMHATRLLACRNILHEALLDAARDESFFRALLEQRTDYVDWVDAMLARLEKEGSLLAARPFPAHFPGPDAPPPDELWDCMADWLHKDGRRAVLFQFVRVLYPTDAVIRHWTCGNAVAGHTLLFFDSSIEPGSLHHIERENIITDPALHAPGKVLIVPYTIRLLRTRLR
ncbi:hypothetical protein [uncultured Bilophila sp.]|nr:hypothetical protein [uncultured Bilophila sp.]